MPYVKSNAVFTCPSDARPTPSPDASGALTINRSYIAFRPAESLTLSQLQDPAETIVVSEKWDKDLSGAAIGDFWVEPFNGDIDYSPTAHRMNLAGDRHRGGINCTFFDGHAKRLTATTIRASKDLTGCTLVHTYPYISTASGTGDTSDMCDQSSAGCNNVGQADANIPGIADQNVCNTFTY